MTNQALQKLSGEHIDSYAFAKALKEIAQEGDANALNEAVERIKAYYDDELEAHLQHEEQTIFAPLFQEYREHVVLATQLLKEHGFFRLLVARISPESAQQGVADFADMLEKHSRTEEEVLFPIIVDLFTPEQMDAVLNHVPLD